MICTRSMQLIVKKTTRTFKTLEGQLLAISNGQRTTLSSRCAELDVQMPLYLGVSRAILDYVIFCHQEDSLWPLAEPSVVKKRFDEIFEATKFTKALDNIKLLRKEYGTEIKLMEKDTMYLKQEKERAEKAQAKVDLLAADIERYREEADRVKQQMEDVAKESQRVFESNQKFQEIIYKLEHLRKEKEMAKSNIERLGKDLVEMTETDEELQGLLDNFESAAEEKRVLKESREAEIAALKQELETTRGNYNKFILLEGQHKGEANAYQEQLQKREKYMVETLNSQELVIPNSLSADNVDATSFANLLNDNRIRLKSQLEHEKLLANRRENAISKKINEISSSKFAQEQKRISLRNQIKTWESEIVQLQDAIDAFNINEGSLAYERSTLKELEEKLASNKSQLANLERKGDLKEKQSQLNYVEERIEKYSNDLAKYNEQSEDRAKLNVLKSDFQKRQSALQALLDSHSNIFKAAVGKELSPATVESDIRDALRKAQSRVDDNTSEVETLKINVSQSEARLSMTKKALRTLTDELATLEKEIYQILPSDIPPSAYEKYRDDISKEYLEAVGNVEFSNFLINYTKDALQNAHEDHSCVLCNRKFVGNEEQTFVSSLKSRSDALPQQLEESNAQLKEYERIIENLTNIGPAVSRITLLSDVLIPEAKTEVEELEESAKDGRRRYDAANEHLDALKSTLAEVERIRRVSGDINRIHKEIESLQAQCADLQSKLATADGTPLVDDGKMSSLNSEARRLKMEINDLNEQREKYRNDVGHLQGSISTKKIEINRQESQLGEKSAKQKQIVDLKSRIAAARDDAANAANMLENHILPELKVQEEALLDAKRESAKQEGKLNESLSEILKYVSDFGQMSRFISEYETKGGNERLENAQRQVAELSAKIESMDLAINAKADEVAAQERVLLDMKGHLRNIIDSMELRRLRLEVEELDAAIKEYESMQAEKEKAAYDKEVERLRVKSATLNSQYSSKMGEVKQMEDQLNYLNRELQSEFLNIHDDYRKAVIRLQTTIVANDDLAKYGKAMDNAIMKYHSMKMEEINRIVDELWKKTYTGTDVDTIIIRSDNENAKGNKSYNYRVCMVKQDIELDMRGRCSAGQKVLASIIIRLALSECFGVNCGLVALDEPTTNLDRENIEALARSLSSIIEMRRVQKNFQLIIITHDETFLTHMNASAYTDHFFKVSRDSRQHSQIQCMPIGRVLN